MIFLRYNEVILRNGKSYKNFEKVLIFKLNFNSIGNMFYSNYLRRILGCYAWLCKIASKLNLGFTYKL